MFICHLYVFFGEVSFQVFCPFQNQKATFLDLVVLFSMSLLAVFFFKSKNTMSDMSFCCIFLTVCGLGGGTNQCLKKKKKNTWPSQVLVSNPPGT